MFTLYVVATPIGNLDDVTPRALQALRAVSVIAAEDTRVARRFLAHFGISGKRLVSYNEHNRAGRIPQLLDCLAAGDVALVSDAGTPAISDPGVELVDAAWTAGHVVTALPGASAVVTALAAAGLRALPFRFIGFLPRRESDLRRLLEALDSDPDTVVAFETAPRLRKTLSLLAETLPERRIAVCRELTKLHEEVFRGMSTEALAHFEAPRGEIVIVIEGGATSEDSEADSTADEAALRDEVREMRSLGLTRAQATALLASRHGLNRRRAYALWLEAETG